MKNNDWREAVKHLAGLMQAAANKDKRIASGLQNGSYATIEGDTQDLLKITSQMNYTFAKCERLSANIEVKRHNVFPNSRWFNPDKYIGDVMGNLEAYCEGTLFAAMITLFDAMYPELSGLEIVAYYEDSKGHFIAFQSLSFRIVKIYADMTMEHI